MSIRFRKGFPILLLVLLVVASFMLGRYSPDSEGSRSPALAQGEQAMPLFGEAWELIDQYFIGNVPDSQLITYGAIRGSMATLEDPYTLFIEPAIRDDERERLQGVFGGIGAYIARSDETDEIILDPIPGNPAEAAGILTGDVLLAIDGDPISIEMSVTEIVNKIKGEKGSTVVLTVRHPGSSTATDISIIRGEILLPSVDYALTDQDSLIGYIRLSRFSGESGKEVEAAVLDLIEQGATSLILDLRQNGGGLRDAAVEVADQFLETGPILYIESRQGEERVYNATAKTIAPREPLVILVDGGTASASEIVAGALQDRGRATLIGPSRTYGKGSVQSVFDLSDGSSIHVTSARWLTPDHKQIDQVGLEPDILVTITQEDIDRGRDPALERAVVYLQENV